MHKVAFKILLELLILFFATEVVITVIWWIILDLGKVIFDCELFDAGLLKTPGVHCPLSATYTQFAWQYSNFHTLLFFITILVANYFYLTLPLLYIISLLIAKHIGRRKLVMPERKFFLLSRLIITKFRISRDKGWFRR